jgi:spermidine synthase
MRLWLFEIGFISLLAQVVLLRELNVAFYGSELIYVLALGVWLAWTAAGAAAGRRRTTPASSRIRTLLVALAFLLPLAVAFVRGSHNLFGGVPGGDLSFPFQMTAMALALLPIGAAFGLLFQWAAKLAIDEGRTLALAYSVESAGGILGGAVATLALAAGLSNLILGLLCALTCLIAAAPPRPRSRTAPPIGRARGAVAAAAALGLLVAIANGGALDRWLTSWRHPLVLATRDTPYGRVTISGSSGQIAIFRNGALVSESEGTAAEEFAHVTLLQHPAPRDVLVLGGTTEGLPREVMQHRPEHVQVVELDPDAFALASAYLPPALQVGDDSDVVRLRFGDPRRILEELPGKFDVILVGMPEPSSAQANRYFTQEFFARCAARLRPQGVLAFRLPAAENLWTPRLLRRAASIRRALAASFADIVVLPGVTNIFLASNAELPRDPGVLAARFEERRLTTRLVSPAYLRYVYTNDRFGETESLLVQTPAPVNTDIRPICYQYTLLIWLSRFYPALLWTELPGTESGGTFRGPALALVLILVSFLAVRRWPAAKRVLLVGVAGFAGMVGETVLILNYQATSGILYQNLGFLLTLFMAGLALGSLAVHRWAPLRREPGSPRGERDLPRWLGAALLVIFALFCGGFARALGAGWGGFLTSAAGLLACGIFVAAIFAYASLASVQNPRAWVSPLYAADLAGGCIGSLAGSLLLVPLLGFANTSLGVGLVAAAALLLI